MSGVGWRASLLNRRGCLYLHSLVNLDEPVVKLEF